MGRPQTRRSISVSGEMYDKARAFAENAGMSISQLTETGLGGVMAMMSSSSVELTKEDRDAACELLNEIAVLRRIVVLPDPELAAARERAAKLLDKLLTTEVRRVD